MVRSARLGTSVLACLGVVSLLAAAAPAVASRPPHPTPPPPDHGIAGSLAGVTTISPTDAWAVGYVDTHKLIMHWDGISWTKVDSPNPPGAKNTYLDGVSASGPDDVWAVGQYDGDDGTQVLIEHWDGATWTVVPGADARAEFPGLIAVSALAPDDVWAVGFGYPGGGLIGALIEHWDGVAWTQVRGAKIHGRNGGDLTSVTAVSATDVWAAGYSVHGIGDRPLVEHWDGEHWSLVHSPGRLDNFSGLNGVSAVSGTQGWAVGEVAARPLLLEWDGSTWSRASQSPVLGRGSALRAVSASTSTAAWVVGYREADEALKPLIEHWDGTAWMRSPTPNIPITRDSRLSAVSADTESDVWAVGSYKIGGKPRVLLEHWDGTFWTMY